MAEIYWEIQTATPPYNQTSHLKTHLELTLLRSEFIGGRCQLYLSLAVNYYCGSRFHHQVVAQGCRLRFTVKASMLLYASAERSTDPEELSLRLP